jgi:hypothetical protein
MKTTAAIFAYLAVFAYFAAGAEQKLPPLEPLGSLTKKPSLMAKASATVVKGWSKIPRTAEEPKHLPLLTQIGPSCTGYGSANGGNFWNRPWRMTSADALQLWKDMRDRDRTARGHDDYGASVPNTLQELKSRGLIEKEVKDLWNEAQIREALLTKKPNQIVFLSCSIFEGMLYPDAAAKIYTTGQALGDHWTVLQDFAPNNKNGCFIFAQSWGDFPPYAKVGNEPKMDIKNMRKLMYWGGMGYLCTKKK